MPSIASEPGWQGLLGAEAMYFSFYGPSVKNRGYEYRRNVAIVTQLQVVLIATTAYSHWETLGNVLGTVFDNVQEPKSSVNTERSRRRGV